jgi:hypothetical protein
MSDYDHLGELAKQVVLRTMQEGEATHPANDFMERPMEEHCEHGHEHIWNAYVDMCTCNNKTQIKDELEHALARVVILLAKLQMEVANA